MSCYTTVEIQAKIATWKAKAAEAESKISAIMAGAQSYQLDTGQTRVLAANATLDAVTREHAYAEGRVAYWCACLTGGNVTSVPGW